MFKTEVRTESRTESRTEAPTESRTHEARVSKAQFAEDAYSKIQGHRHNYICANRNEQTLNQAGTRRQSAVYDAEYETGKNDCIGDCILLCCLV